MILEYLRHNCINDWILSDTLKMANLPYRDPFLIEGLMWKTMQYMLLVVDQLEEELKNGTAVS